MSTPQSDKRQQLIRSTVQAIQENSTAAVFFHTLIASQAGLGATEEKTLLILSSRGAMTAGEISKAIGLTTSSVTSLLDRLEKKNCIRRVHDTQDRRRVIIEPLPGAFAPLTSIFARLSKDFQSLLDPYTDEQLATITDFLHRATSQAHATMELLRQESPEK